MATVKYERDLKALEQRRRKGMRMLARGVTQAEVARVLDVSRQTVSNWAGAVNDRRMGANP
jgi:transposase